MAGIDPRMQQFIQAETERQRFQARICFQNKHQTDFYVREAVKSYLADLSVKGRGE